MKYFYDMMWERYLSLKKNRLIKVNNNGINITDKGYEFLDSKNKKYFLYKNAVEIRLRKSNNPKALLECFRQYVLLSKTKRENISKVLKSGYEIDYDDVPEEAYDDYQDLVSRVRKRITKDVTFDTFSNGLYETSYGSIKISKIPIDILRRILKDINKKN